jgi:hypothetical protein
MVESLHQNSLRGWMACERRFWIVLRDSAGGVACNTVFFGETGATTVSERAAHNEITAHCQSRSWRHALDGSEIRVSWLVVDRSEFSTKTARALDLRLDISWRRSLALKLHARPGALNAELDELAQALIERCNLERAIDCNWWTGISLPGTHIGYACDAIKLGMTSPNVAEIHGYRCMGGPRLHYLCDDLTDPRQADVAHVNQS